MEIVGEPLQLGEEIRGGRWFPLRSCLPRRVDRDGNPLAPQNRIEADQPPQSSLQRGAAQSHWRAALEIANEGLVRKQQVSRFLCWRPFPDPAREEPLCRIDRAGLLHVFLQRGSMVAEPALELLLRAC